MSMKLQPTSVRRVLCLAGALALSAAAPAIAQEEKPLKGSFDQPLQNDAQGDSESQMMMSESDGEHTYTVKIANDKVVSAEVDGKKIPKSRVRHKNGKVEILDEDGNVQKTLNAHVMTGAGGMHFQGVPGGLMQVQPWGGQNNPGGGGAGGLTLMEQPRVMMGITMSDAEENGGALVDSVVDGLPASKGGLQVGDRITTADGKKIEGQQALRDILKGKNPGDSIELKVDRDGKTKTVTVKLAKFDAEKMGIPMAQGGGGTNIFRGFADDHHQAFEDAKKSLQKALDDIASSDGLKADKIKVKATEALKRAIEALDQAKDKVSMEMGDLHGELLKGFKDGQWRVWPNGEGGKGGAFVVPTPPPTPDAGVGRQLEKLSEQIDRLNKRLDQLEKDRK
jgi:plasmid maintenance system killer protein